VQAVKLSVQDVVVFVHRVTQMPTTMEQLLEHQWEQGSEFLMQQGQHFDSEYYFTCLCVIAQIKHCRLVLRYFTLLSAWISCRWL